MREGNFLGVVATTEWGAIQAARKLKATWSNWEGLPERAHLWEHVRATRINSDEVTSNVGDSAKALSDAPKRISATYDFAIHTHGSIGPSCAVVEINDGKITCWSASQATHTLRRQLAAMMECHSTMCTASISKVRAVTAAMGTKTRPATPRSCPRGGRETRARPVDAR